MIITDITVDEVMKMSDKQENELINHYIETIIQKSQFRLALNQAHFGLMHICILKNQNLSPINYNPFYCKSTKK